MVAAKSQDRSPKFSLFYRMSLKPTQIFQENATEERAENARLVSSTNVVFVCWCHRCWGSDQEYVGTKRNGTS